MKKLSGVKDIHAFVIRPLGNNGIITVKDQKVLKQYPIWAKAKYCIIHFSTSYREETIAKIKAVGTRLSKNMLVTEITDAQFGRRGKDKETIPNTGIHATKKQLEDSFVIGDKGCRLFPPNPNKFVCATDKNGRVLDYSDIVRLNDGRVARIRNIEDAIRIDGAQPPSYIQVSILDEDAKNGEVWFPDRINARTVEYVRHWNS